MWAELGGLVGRQRSLVCARQPTAFLARCLRSRPPSPLPHLLAPQVWAAYPAAPLASLLDTPSSYPPPHPPPPLQPPNPPNLLSRQVWAAYSPVKNSPADAAAKWADGNPSHSATAAELDWYMCNCKVCRGAGMPPATRRCTRLPRLPARLHAASLRTCPCVPPLSCSVPTSFDQSLRVCRCCKPWAHAWTAPPPPRSSTD